MSNFIDYSARRGRRDTPSPEASIVHENSSNRDDPFSERESEAPQSEILAANPYSSPFAQNQAFQRDHYTDQGEHHGGHGGQHIDVEQVHTMGDTTHRGENPDAFFDPTFGGESCLNGLPV